MYGRRVVMCRGRPDGDHPHGDGHGGRQTGQQCGRRSDPASGAIHAGHRAAHGKGLRGRGWGVLPHRTICTVPSQGPVPEGPAGTRVRRLPGTRSTLESAPTAGQEPPPSACMRQERARA